MSVSADYDQYLSAFGRSQPVIRLKSFWRRHVRALRHDVDHSVDMALDLAYFEQRRGHISTYFILHDAPYMSDPDVFAKIRQIQSLGHEIGLHTNFLAQWWRGEIDDVASALSETLDQFRAENIDIKGVAAHGDPDCYKGQFTNYWLWRDIKPGNPALGEARVIAEGLCVDEDATRFIAYPSDRDYLERADGKRFQFWSLRLKDFGLKYESSRMRFAHYYSDSGGSWRTAEPDAETMQRGRHLALMHPEHWLGPQKHFYFLAPPRSATVWLADLLDTSSTLKANHEFTLNYDGDQNSDDKIVYKNTSRIGTLLKDKARTLDLINISRSWSEDLKSDYAEANVYLPEVIDLLPHGRDTKFIHIIRDPAATVRSLRQRGWYNTPYDVRYPAVDVEGWHQMSQIEQICWFVRTTHEKLLAACDASLVFEKMVSDREYLKERLGEFGISIVDDLFDTKFGVRKNETKAWDVDPLDVWPQAERDTYNEICGGIEAALGYDRAREAVQHPEAVLPPESDMSLPAPNVSEVASLKHIIDTDNLTTKNVVAVTNDAPISLSAEVDDTGYVLLGGGHWRPGSVQAKSKSISEAQLDLYRRQVFKACSGWLAEPLTIYTVDLGLALAETDGPVRLFCLSYDDTGELISQRLLSWFDHSEQRIQQHFRPDRAASRFNLALFKDKGSSLAATLTDFCLASHDENRASALPPEDILQRVEAGTKTEPGEPAYSLAALQAAIEAHDMRTCVKWNVDLKNVAGSLVIVPNRDVSSAHAVLIGRGTWHDGQADPLPWPDEGEESMPALAVTPGRVLSGTITGKSIDKTSPCGVMILFHDADGALKATLRIADLTASKEHHHFTFAMLEQAATWSLAIQMSAGHVGAVIDNVSIYDIDKQV